MLRRLIIQRLKDHWLDSKEIKSAIFIHPSFFIIGLLGASKALFVSILAALFCSFCSSKSVFEPLNPHKEQQ